MAKKIEYISTTIAAEEIGCDRKTIERRIREGKLTAYKFGRHFRIVRTDWETFKARHFKKVA